ncbi:MAG: hypothetical protein A4E28_02313 [Methanocella sp. PtaU1.Bin125]|nr:MAG: hypothetical protein A4E28_02313 [Methanocella sp. PtaU1.Bin125]
MAKLWPMDMSPTAYPRSSGRMISICRLVVAGAAMFIRSIRMMYAADATRKLLVMASSIRNGIEAICVRTADRARPTFPDSHGIAMKPATMNMLATAKTRPVPKTLAWTIFVKYTLK